MYSARIVADSVGPNRARLTTFEISFPRIVLAEFNTHRMFSRNSASSRAIPVEKMLARVKEDPFVPIYWGKNQKGMQAAEEFLDGSAEKAEIEHIWTESRNYARNAAWALKEAGVHKQITNRLLEPWLWHSVIVTATEWGNFFHLRRDKAAQPEIRKIADMMWDLYEAAKPDELGPRELHLPFATPEEHATLPALTLAKVCVGRCARVSYLTHDGKRDLDADVKLHDDLLENGHMSPSEHVAVAMTLQEWQNFARKAAMDWIDRRIPMGNFWGFCQYRKGLEREHDRLGPPPAPPGRIIM
jgi:thymidylate synthase ThyX